MIFSVDSHPGCCVDVVKELTVVPGGADKGIDSAKTTVGGTAAAPSATRRMILDVSDYEHRKDIPPAAISARALEKPCRALAVIASRTVSISF